MSEVDQTERRHDVAIIGAGPAGLTAATYLRRFLRSCIVLDAGASRARYIPESHNCPGFPQGVSGDALLRRMREQAEAFGTPIIEARVDRVAREGDDFVVFQQERRWHARKLVIATGLADRLPDVDWAEAAIACGALRLCAICDAYEARDGRIAIHGPAEGLLGHARFLRAYSRQLALLPSDRDLDGDALREAQALGIEVYPAGGQLHFDGRRCLYRQAASAGHAEGDTATGRDDPQFDSVYPYLGYTARHALLEGLGLSLSEDGELEVDRHQQTRVPGLYAIGDVVSGLNQISVAVGQAAVAATHVHNQLPFVARGAVTPG